VFRVLVEKVIEK